MKAVCYARVSSVAQRDRDTIAAQLRLLPEFVARQGWTLARPIETYVDDGHSAKSGKLAARGGLAALLRDATLGVFDVVCVMAIDRLTRADDLTERGAILGAFQRAGVKIADASSGQILDLSSNMGDLYSSLGAIFAAEENRKRADRIKAGKATAIARNRKPAGPTPYGLDYDRKTFTFSIDEPKAAIVREIFARIIGGESCKIIADDLTDRGAPAARHAGQWETTRVWKIARASYVTGDWIVDKDRKLALQVPAIISAAIFDDAQAALIRHRKRGLDKSMHVYLLNGGIGVCGLCGGDMQVSSATTNANRPRSAPTPATYVCANRRLNRRANCIRIASILQDAIRNKHAIKDTCEIVHLFVLHNKYGYGNDRACRTSQNQSSTSIHSTRV